MVVEHDQFVVDHIKYSVDDHNWFELYFMNHIENKYFTMEYYSCEWSQVYEKMVNYVGFHSRILNNAHYRFVYHLHLLNHARWSKTLG